MGGPTTQTTTTAPANQDVNATVSSLAKGINQQYGAAPGGFYVDKSMYAGTGSTTDNALASLLSNANQSNYGTGFGDSFSETADIAAGRRFGENAPGFAALRSKLIDDVTTNNLNAFNSSGMFGSDSNRRSLSEGLGNALGGLDYGNYQNDIARQERAQAALGSRFADTMRPGQSALEIGRMQDTDAQAQLMADADLESRRFNAPTDYLAKLTSILTGNAAAGGTNTSTTMPGPNPLQLLLGGGLGLAGLLF